MRVDYSIQAASEKSGLPTHTIRAWERRHGVLAPSRTGSNRRVYTEQDVEHLRLLRNAVEAGHSIGLIAALGPEDLRRLAVEPRTTSEPSRNETPFLEETLTAIRALDPKTLGVVLARAYALLGVDAFLASVAVPLVKCIGDGWESGCLSISQEHIGTAVLRAQLERIAFDLGHSGIGPRLVSTTPSNQVHELGALLVVVAAVAEGWQVTYLGPNVPAAEIARTAKETGADVVALSLVYPENDPDLPLQLADLREMLEPQALIYAGGRAARSYSAALGAIGATTCHDLDFFRHQLRAFSETHEKQLRTPNIQAS